MNQDSPLNEIYWSRLVNHGFYLKTMRFFIFCCLLLLVTGVRAQIKILPTPSWVEYQEIPNVSDLTTSEQSDEVYYLMADRQVHVKKQVGYYHHTLQVQSEEGVQNYSSVDVTYDPSYQQVIFHTLQIVRNGKSINKLNPQQFEIIRREKSAERHVYDGSLTAFLNLSDVRIGDIIDYEYSIVGRNPIYKNRYFGSFYMNFSVPIGLRQVRIVSPADRELFIKTTNQAQQAGIEEHAGYKVYTWTSRDVNPLLKDSNVPYWFDPYDEVLVSEYRNWQEVIDWAQELYLPELQTTNRDLEELVQEIRQQHSEIHGQLLAALKFVQDQIRYLGLENGISAYKPHPPAEVLSQRFGDCKDKSLLLSNILTKLGMEAYPSLINTTYKDAIKQWLPSPGAFNHCVVRVKLENQEVWLDPTITLQRGQEEVYFPNYKVGLVIDHEQQGLVDIPYKSRSNQTFHETFQVPAVDSAAVVALKVVSRYYGPDADSQRRYFSRNSMQQIEKNYLNYYAKNYPDITGAEALKFEDDSLENVFTTIEEYKIKHFWYYPEGSSTLTADVYPQPIRDNIGEPGTLVRKMPFALDFPVKVKHSVDVVLPEPWNVDDLETSVEGTGIKYQSAIMYKGDTVHVTYDYETTSEYIEAEKTSEYLENKEKVINDLYFQITYDEDETTATASLVVALLLTMLLGVAAYLYYKNFDPPAVMERSYPNIGGWLIIIGIGLVISPIISLVSLIGDGYLGDRLWQITFNAQFVDYNPAQGALVYLEGFWLLSIFISSVLLLMLFFEKRTSFPKTFIFILIADIVITIIITVGVYNTGLDKSLTWSEIFTDMFGSIVRGCIWIPYFLISQRVKGTFTTTRHSQMVQKQEKLIFTQ